MARDASDASSASLPGATMARDAADATSASLPGATMARDASDAADRIPPWEAAGSAMPPWATANAEGMQVILFSPIVFRLYFLEPWNAFYGAAPLLSPKSQLSPTFQT